MANLKVQIKALEKKISVYDKKFGSQDRIHGAITDNRY